MMKALHIALLFLMLVTAGPMVQAEAEGTEATKAAITQVARDYEAAYNKGDVAALAAMFAEDVEYTDEDGVLTKGRADLELILRRAFILNPGSKLQLQIESVRLLASDVAVEHGTSIVTAKDGEQVSSAYTAIHVQKDGKWTIHELVESPVVSPSPGEMLSSLAWMIGKWHEKDGDASVETKVDWARGGNFMTRTFKVTVGDKVTLEGWQVIGWDAAEKKIRSWLFDSEGAFQTGEWRQSGNGWMIDQVGVLPDGSKMTMTSMLQRMSDDKCSWETVNRTLDGDPQPNLPRIELDRIK